MESVLPLVTLLRNETLHSIDFSFEEGSCPIPSLGPRERRLVYLSRIVNICRRRRRRSTSRLIKVLINQRCTGMILEPEIFFQHVEILFKFQINDEGELVLVAEGIKEKNIDIILRLSWNIGFLLGRNRIWSRRKYALITDAPVESPMNMQQTMKEERPQTESDDSVKHAEVNPSRRKEKGLDLDIDNDTDAFIQRKNVASPESQSMSDKNVIGRAEAQGIARSTRKKSTTYTPLDRSKHDTFRTKISNSSQMEPLEREGNGPDFQHYHYQQHLTGEFEHDHPPYSSHVPKKDTYDHVFLLGFALLMVVFIHIVILG